MQTLNITLPIVGTPSRTEQGIRCHRKHFVGDNLCLQPRQRDEASMSWGTVVHAGAAEWWRTGVLAAALAAADASWTEYQRWLEPRSELSREMTAAVVQGYTEQALLGAGHWAAKLPGWEPFAVEQRVVVELDPRARISFQMDHGAKHAQSGSTVLVDTKTHGRQSGYFRRDWERKWQFHPQQMIYQWVLRTQYGVEGDLEHYIEGVARDVPTKVSYLRLPTYPMDVLAEAKEQLVRICQKDAEIVARATEVDGTVDGDKLLHLALTETEYNPAECFAYGQQCGLYDVCTAPTAQRAGLVKDRFEYVEPVYLD